PSRRTRPELGTSSPANRPSSVDLPDPELPVMASAWPLSTVKLTLSKISSAPEESATLWDRCSTSIEWELFMWIGWRSVVVALSGILFAGAVAQADVADKSQDKTILVVGDSLSAEYGLRRGSGWVELLARRLHAEQQGYQIRN